MAKKAISAFNDHFQAILTEADNTFPMHLWDWLYPQAENTLNMTRPTNIALTISAYSYMYRQHDFNKMPSAPMGCVVMLHNKPDIRKTWDNHAIEGYYVEKSKEHYSAGGQLVICVHETHFFYIFYQQTTVFGIIPFFKIFSSVSSFFFIGLNLSIWVPIKVEIAVFETKT